MSKETVTTCETQGAHIFGHEDKCIFCGEPNPKTKGPVEILCKEIGFTFDERMETQDMLIAFVAVLVKRIEQLFGMKDILSGIGGEPASDDAKEVLRLTKVMLEANNEWIEKAANVHDLCRQVNPDEGPCDHLIDMLSSCASAIRFGLEKPCRSRHAAHAGQHIWKHIYGIRQFDNFTSSWEKEWQRAQLQEAIMGWVI